MAYEVNVLPVAKADLDAAVAYIVHSLASPRAAAQLINTFESSLQKIANNPYGYPKDVDISKRVGIATRRCRVRKYLLYYVVTEESLTISVIGFQHGSRDASRVFISSV